MSDRDRFPDRARGFPLRLFQVEREPSSLVPRLTAEPFPAKRLGG